MVLPILAAGAATPAAADAKPKMLLIHGGAWSVTGPAVTATMAPTAKRFEKLGFERSWSTGPAGDGAPPPPARRATLAP